jgi:hypothetical protein
MSETEKVRWPLEADEVALVRDLSRRLGLPDEAAEELIEEVCDIARNVYSRGVEAGASDW